MEKMNPITRRKFIRNTMLSSAALPLMSNLSTGSVHTSRATPPLNIYLFSKHLRFLSIESMAEAAAEIGFDGVVLTVRPKGHVLPEQAADVLPLALEHIKKNGLKADMMTTSINDPDNETTKKILSTAASHGIETYRMGYWRYEKEEQNIPAALRRFRKKMQKLAVLNKKLGIRGGYQNHSGSYVGASLWEVWQLLEHTNEEGIGAQYDIRHATVEGGYYWKTSLQLLQKRIVSVVLKDFKWQKVNGKWKTVNTPIGEGMALYPEVYAAYDLQYCAFYKVWKGGIFLDGAAFNNIKTTQPTSWGTAYLEENPESPAWYVKLSSEPVAVSPSFKGYTVRKNQINFHYQLLIPDGGPLIATWDSLGAVYLLKGVETGDTTGIRIKRIATGLAMRLMSHETQHPDRGSTLKIAPDGSFKKINFGLRQANGIGIGVDGELFITENQGRWVPSCKVIHVQPGVFHGCRLALKDSLPDIEMKPPAVWLPQDEIGNSPGQPVYVSEGTYTGQMLHGEVTHGGIKRVFPEKVNGEYQGCVFRFSQGLEAGINRMVRGPEGGLEIEFTKPLKAGRGENSTDYTVQQWRYEPTPTYGGPKLDHTALPVKRIIVSPDRHKVHLIIPDRKEKHVVYIRLNDQLISKDNETLWSGETWYTLNAIPEANNR